MRSRRAFWGVAAVAALAGIPLALGLRARLLSDADTHFHGGDPDVLTALEQLDGPRRRDALKAFADDPVPARRQAAAEALEGERDDDALQIARALLADNDSEVRVKATYALARSDTPQSRPLLRAALRDEDAWVRLEAVQWIASVAGRGARPQDRALVPDLVARLDDPTPPVRAFASDALRKITGKNERYSLRLSAAEGAAVIRRWKAWAKTAVGTAPPVTPIVPRRTDPAPTVPLRTIDGQTFTPASSGRITLVNFWGTWCAPCVEEVSGLERLHRRFRDQGVDVVGVALDEPDGARSLRAWCRKQGLTYPQCLAQDPVTEAYGDIHGVPVTVLVDRAGRIRYRWQGERDASSFAAAVARLLKEG